MGSVDGLGSNAMASISPAVLRTDMDCCLAADLSATSLTRSALGSRRWRKL